MIKLRLTIQFAFAFLALMVSTGCVNRYFYFPNAIEYRNRDSLGAPVTEETFFSKDGTKLNGWMMRSLSSNVLGTVVHFHGNAQNLTAHSSFVDWLPSEGYNVFMFDYRGYGKSEGKPSRRGLYQDGVAAMEFVRTLPGVDTNRIVMLGQSLGGATALAVAGRHPELAGRAVIVESTFYSYRRIVRDKIGLIPVLSLLRVPLSYLVISDAYSPAPVLKSISPTPILYMHGTDDRVVPVYHARLLYKKSAEPKHLLIMEGGGHICGFNNYRDVAEPAVLNFLEKVLWSNAVERVAD